MWRAIGYKEWQFNFYRKTSDFSDRSDFKLSLEKMNEGANEKVISSYVNCRINFSLWL